MLAMDGILLQSNPIDILNVAVALGQPELVSWPLKEGGGVKVQDLAFWLTSRGGGAMVEAVALMASYHMVGGVRDLSVRDLWAMPDGDTILLPLLRDMMYPPYSLEDLLQKLMR